MHEGMFHLFLALLLSLYYKFVPFITCLNAHTQYSTIFCPWFHSNTFFSSLFYTFLHLIVLKLFLSSTFATLLILTFSSLLLQTFFFLKV